MTDLLHVGAGALAGSGAFALGALRRARSTAKAGIAPAARRLEIPALEAAGLYDGYGAHDVEYHYCPAEFRVTPHLPWGDGKARCWHCPEGDA